MKLLLFTSYRGWSHGRKWLEFLAPRHEVHVATFKDFGEHIPRVTVHAILGADAARAGEPERRDRTATGTAGTPPWLVTRIGFKYARQFGQLVDELKPDVVHAHQSVPFGWYATCALRASATKPPFVVSVWGSDVMRYPEGAYGYRWLNRRVLRRATALTATSRALRQSTYRWTRRRDAVIVPFGVDTAHFSSKEHAPERAIVFGMAKQLKTDVYGIEDALRAFARALRQRPELRLEIAGDGPARADFEQLARTLRIEQSVKFLGQQTSETMPGVYRSWDAYLMPSHQESFGVAALEAEASGLPVLAARTGGIPEVVEDGVTAQFVEPFDILHLAEAIVKVSDDSALLQSAHERGPAWVHKHYEWSDCGAQMEQVYRDVVGAQA